MGVAKYMGGTVTARQCNTRWGLYVSKFQKEGVKRAQWSEREVRPTLYVKLSDQGMYYKARFLRAGSRAATAGAPSSDQVPLERGHGSHDEGVC